MDRLAAKLSSSLVSLCRESGHQIMGGMPPMIWFAEPLVDLCRGLPAEACVRAAVIVISDSPVMAYASDRWRVDEAVSL